MNESIGTKSPYVQEDVGGLVSKLSWKVRKAMFKALMQVAAPTSETKVLDVGVTSDRREDCNFFERLYPYPHQITAVGLEDASFLETEFPGLTYVQANALSLPFPDKSFDLVFSSAVIEHVGSREQQRMFVRELSRVGHTVCITTPNRWYPIEFHTILPLVHWLPPAWFRQILRWLGKDFYAKEENLNLLTRKEVLAMIPSHAHVTELHYRLWGLVSNLVFYIRLSETT
ncbi:MAG: methyltransferase domain-containing protein [Cyanobacteria bacterium]|nr:methyltransferase domain-containing protein [Cyanobacteriota bacterium]MDW8202053.1 class I SAM-dependent methyltransferase [Cyanobacteriota bacterium SKYGB_h_bin112]